MERNQHRATPNLDQLAPLHSKGQKTQKLVREADGEALRGEAVLEEGSTITS